MKRTFMFLSLTVMFCFANDLAMARVPQLDSLHYASVLDSINYHIGNDKGCDECMVLIEHLTSDDAVKRFPSLVSMGFRRLVDCWRFKAESYNALPTIDRLGRLAKATGNMEMSAWHNFLQAELMFNANVKDSVLPLLHRALDQFEKIGTSKDGLSLSCEYLGGIYWDIKDTAQSIYYHKRSLEYAEDNKWLRHIMLANIALYYTRIKDYTSARQYTEMALAEGRLHGRGLSVSYVNLLKIDHASGASDQVIHTDFERAVEEGEKWNDSNALMYAHTTYEAILLRRGFFEKAKQQLINTERVLKGCQECLGYEANHYYTGYKLYDTIGQAASALHYLEKYTEANRKYDEQQTQRNIKLAHATHEFDKRQEEMRAKQEQEMALADEKLNSQRRQKSYFVLATVLFAIMSGLILKSLYKERDAKQLISSQKLIIESEHKRSEELLLNILPAQVAEELKTKGEADARLFNEVTVLFTDFKGFTAMSEQLSPKELVRDIHECFSVFDEIAQRHGIEKIKTIGDAYMAAGGVPVNNETHATNVVQAALEIRDFIEKGKALKIAIGKPYFEIRIGIHTGPVVAGIVGIKKFQYDIWGDTVNTASRMESSGEVGKVNISQTTYELVKNEFNCSYRGEIEAKGKGPLRMYFAERDSGMKI